jgi:hypothetical protein
MNPVMSQPSSSATAPAPSGIKGKGMADLKNKMINLKNKAITAGENSYIYKNKSVSFMGILFIVYFILVIYFFKYNPNELATKYSSLSIVVTLFGGFILLMLTFFIQRREEIFMNIPVGDKPGIISYLAKLAIPIFAFVIVFSLVIILLYFAKDVPTFSNMIILLINMVIFFTAIAFIMQLFKKPLTTSKRPNWQQLIIDIVFLIPCFITDFVNYVKYQYNITTKPIWILFLLEIIFITLKFTIPKLFGKIIRHDSVSLVSYPVFLNNLNTVGSYETLHKNKNNNEKYNYNYAISAWIKIDAQPPSANSSYSENANILSYGGKPSILYNASKNEIIIMAKTGKKEEVVYKTNDIPYQKWTNYIINYQGGTLDIFIDNKLVSSTPGIVPYMSYDNITIGKVNGIYGLAANVEYFNKTLTRNKIDWIYKSTDVYI